MELEEKKSNKKNLAIIFGTTLMAVLGVSSITPAFPTIMDVLDLTETQVGMLITVFTLPGIFLTPVLGLVADRYGRKNVLIPSLMLFGISGGICFFIQDYSQLLILRFLQGTGAAALGSMGTILIGDLYSGSRRASIMGYNASILSIGTAFYPLIGGALAVLSWNHPFLLPWIAVPIGLFALRYMKNPKINQKQSLTDYLNNSWKEIKRPEVYGIFITVMLVFIVLYGSYLTYFSTMLGKIFGASSFVIGIIMFSTSISSAIVSSRLGILSRHFKKANLVISGFAFYLISMVAIVFIDSLWFFIAPAILFGIGNGLLIPSIHTLIAEKANIEMRGMFMSVTSSMLRVGQTLGPPVIGIAFSLKGYEGAFGAGAGLAITGMIISFFMLNTKN